MKSPNYGWRITSAAARYSARYYRIVIAFFVAFFVLLEAIPAPPRLLRWTVGLMSVYAAYVLARMLLPIRLYPRYYRPRVQFLRAQAGILSLTVLLAPYAILDEPNSLWLLYTLGIMIVSEHCSTSAVLFTLGELFVIMVSLGAVGSGLPFGAYLSMSDPFLGALKHSVGVILLGFLTHYLVRNVSARDLTIRRIRHVLNRLGHNTDVQEDLSAARKLLVRVLEELSEASCCSIWSLNPADNTLTVKACIASGEDSHDETAYCSSCPSFLSLEDLDADDLMGRVLDTHKPHFTTRRTLHPQHLTNEAIKSSETSPGNSYRTAHFVPRGLFGETALEFGIPVPESSFHDPASVSILYVAFDNVKATEEIGQKYSQISDIVHCLSPTILGASLVNQEQALRELSKTVVETLDPHIVLDRLNTIAINEFGFDHAIAYLMDKEQGVIRPSRSRNVPQSWLRQDVHALDSDDIHACVAQQSESEVIVGRDPRIDEHIWAHYGNRADVRIYVPLRIPDPETGQRHGVGVLEVGRRGPDIDKHTAERQASLLEPFADLAALAAANAQLYTRAESTARALTELHRTGDALLSEDWDPQLRLDHALDSALKVLDASFILVYLRTEGTDRLDLMSLKGAVRGAPSLHTRLGQGTILDSLVANPQPLYIREAQEDPRLVGYGGADGHARRTFTQVQGVRSFAGLPLLLGENVRALMCINYREPRRFTQTERDTAELFAQQIARILHEVEQRERQRERYRRRILDQERSAFSHELHSSLSQDLHAIGYKAAYVLDHIEGSPREVVHQVEDILEIAGQGKREIQYLLSELSSSLSNVTDFRHALKAMVARVRRYYPDIVVKYELNAADDELWDVLTPDTHFRLCRIAKDAFNNIVTHSRCESMTVLCNVDAEIISLTITDDGVGFRPDDAAHQSDSFGLSHIRENVRELGGEARINSAPGEGTEIAVSVPLKAASGGMNDGKRK